LLGKTTKPRTLVKSYADVKTKLYTGSKLKPCVSLYLNTNCFKKLYPKRCLKLMIKLMCLSKNGMIV